MAYSRRYLARELRGGKYTSVGCYPKFWVAADGSVLSYEAIMADARRYLRETGRADFEPEWCIVGCAVNWEDPALYCDVTGERIESAYAEPEEQCESETSP